MPYIRLAPAYSPFAAPQQASVDPILDFLSAAFGPDVDHSSKKAEQQQQQQQRSQSQPAKKPAQGFGCRAACAPRQRVYKRLINPSFDVSELPESYVLEGELPGVSDKSSISISFDDAQTIVIKGEVSRVNRLASQQQEEAVAAATKDTTITSEAEKQLVSEDDASSTTKTHSVTVEEVEDESETASNDEFEVVDGPTPTKTDKGKQAAATGNDVEMTEATPAATEPQPEQTKPSVPQPRYWISERSVGIFERKFNFQGLIDQEGVKANLENGLLTVVVPKRKAYVRRVNID